MPTYAIQTTKLTSLPVICWSQFIAVANLPHPLMCLAVHSQFVDDETVPRELFYASRAENEAHKKQTGLFSFSNQLKTRK